MPSRVISDDRRLLDEAACGGAGITRLTDFTQAHYLVSGLLVPVLADWESIEAPMIFAAYPPSRRRSRLVRVFVDFLVEAFVHLGNDLALFPHHGSTSRTTPAWFGRTRGCQSAYVAHTRHAAVPPIRYRQLMCNVPLERGYQMVRDYAKNITQKL